MWQDQPDSNGYWWVRSRYHSNDVNMVLVSDLGKTTYPIEIFGSDDCFKLSEYPNCLWMKVTLPETLAEKS